MHYSLRLLIFVAVTNSVIEGQDVQNNKSALSSVNVLSRNKRYLPLIFNNGGTLKFVGGFLTPTDIPKFQNINCLNNMQYQYGVPTTVAQLYKIYKTRNLEQYRSGNTQGDKTREIAYKLLEQMLNNSGKNGKHCILRTICQVAEMPIKSHNGLIGELFYIMFSPSDEEEVNPIYKMARKAGLQGANCTELYSKCPHGDGILDSISVIHDLELPQLTEAVGF